MSVARLTALLLLPLVLGCSSGPAPRGDPEQPFGEPSLEEAIKRLGERMRSHTAAGWPDHVPCEDGIPRVKVGDLLNRSDDDRKEDFADAFSFREAFDEGYRPDIRSTEAQED